METGASHSDNSQLMPELPEVETMRRGLLPAVGSRIGGVVFAGRGLKPVTVYPSRAALRRQVPGQHVQQIQRRGKRIVLGLSGGPSIVIEPRMTGLVLLADPPDQEHLRLGLSLEAGPVPWLWFWDRRGLGTIALLEPEAAGGPPGTGPLRAGCPGCLGRRIAATVRRLPP